PDGRHAGLAHTRRSETSAQAALARGVERNPHGARRRSIVNSFLWSVYPYLCIGLFFVVPIIRMATKPFEWSTRASGLFTRTALGAGSSFFHWGLLLIATGHLLGLYGGLLG